MSTDYVLFIIVVPNDFHLADSRGSISAPSEPEPLATSSIDTLAALMVPASITLPILTPLVSKKSEENSHSPSAPLSLCILLKNFFAEKTDIEAVWVISDDKKVFQISFCVRFGFISDRLLQDLVKMNIGTRNDTKVFVLPTTVILQNQLEKNDDNDNPTGLVPLTHDVDQSNLEVNDVHQGNISSTNDRKLSEKIRKRINKSDFKKSVRARLMVHQVVASIRASSALSFDFVLLICLASMLAAFGLLENSTVILVASMLVSPLMNPILGIVFGLSIRDPSLWQRGLRNELVGLILCTSCGFFLGLFTMVFETKWGSSTSFPTSEMKSRGDIERLWVGVLIALPSGAGVALSVLGGNTGSLVGVAISASLLPPAVNCGLLFAYALLGRLFPKFVAVHLASLSNTTDSTFSGLHCAKFRNNNYSPIYTCNLAVESAILACSSLLLTIVNIICIIIMGLFILRIKEVVPLHNTNKNVANFFHYDVKVARDYNKTIHQDEFTGTLNLRNNRLAQSIVNHWKTFKALPNPTISPQLSSLSTAVTPNLDAVVNENDLGFPFNLEIRQKLFRLSSFAKEYDLDVFHPDDYELNRLESEEKVRLLVGDLVDMCEETTSGLNDFHHLQPTHGHKTLTDEDCRRFYEEIIELLPKKWYQLFLYERERRLMTLSALTFRRSSSLRFDPSKNLHQSLTKRQRREFQRQSSMPHGNFPSSATLVHEENEIPIKGTRFRIVKPN